MSNTDTSTHPHEADLALAIDGQSGDDDATATGSRFTRRAWWWGGAAVVLVVIVVAVVSLSSSWGGTDAVGGSQLSTATVTRTDLVDRETVSGTIEFADSAEVVTQSTGTITALATAGTGIKRNDVLWRVDQQPTALWYGGVPAYRTLSSGSSGKDVRQVERNLKALGYDGFTVDGEYTGGTAEAVAAWQDDMGLADTGTLTLGEVYFRPGKSRVADELVVVGGTAQPGASILALTSNERIVAIDLDTSDQSLAAVGDKVTVTLPDGADTTGKITSIGSVATSASDSNSGGVGGSTSNDSSTVPVVVALDDPKLASQWDSAPVRVGLVAERAENVLTVPVSALLALAEGGFAVEVESGEATQLVAVETGIYADGRVEVSGSGIQEGMTVVVPKS
ncbi:MAG: peptidoglycan-binding protein [Actinobacteria bacterium]|nr:peptidoglycan-binding protein [Actinomycetota bacterium]